jgi:Tol biopolymer transport system component
MTEYKDVLERIGDRASMPEPAFDRMVRRRRRRRRNNRISAVAVGAVITAVLLFALARVRPTPGAVPADTPTPTASNGLVAYTVPAGGQEEPGIYVAGQSDAPRRAISSDGGALWCPAFSPDGTRLAFTRWRDPSTDVLVADVTRAGVVGGSERVVSTAQDWPCPEWAPDGQRLLYADAEGLRTVDVTGSEPPILVLGLDANEIRDVEWSPDGSLIAVAQAFDTSVLILSARNGEVVGRAEGVPFGELSWSPSGDRIAVGQAAVDGHQPVRLITVKDSDSEELIADGRTFAGYGAPSWSPDGRSLALLDHSGGATHDGIVIVRPGDDGWYRVPLPPVRGPHSGRLDVWRLRWSPDGQELLVASGCSVHTMPVDGQGPAVLISSPDVDPQMCLRPPGLDWQAVFP